MSFFGLTVSEEESMSLWNTLLIQTNTDGEGYPVLTLNSFMERLGKTSWEQRAWGGGGGWAGEAR